MFLKQSLTKSTINVFKAPRAKPLQATFFPHVNNTVKVAPVKTSFRGSPFPSVIKRFYTTQENLQLTVEDGPVPTFKVSVPLPSNQKVLFAVKGDQSVKQFLANLHEEDASVNQVGLYTSDGTKVSNSAPLSEILRSGFKLSVNDKTFNVSPVTVAPVHSSGRSTSTSAPLDFEAFEAYREQRKHQEFEKLKKEFIPLYLQKVKHDKKVSRLANAFIWGGMGYLVAQWCVLARLTWWDFNWDIMEPVTYFITFGTGVLGYAYFAIAKREYTYGDLRDAVKQRGTVSTYLGSGFDFEKYYFLEHRLKKLDEDALAKIEIEAEHQAEQPVAEVQK